MTKMFLITTVKSLCYRTISLRLLRLAVALQLALSLLGCQPKAVRQAERLRIVSWNVQNLFDTQWQGTEYPEYDPRPAAANSSKNSRKNPQTPWNRQGFRYRLKSLAPVLDRLDADILVLSEVESVWALRQLNLQLRRPFPYQLLLAQSDQAVNIGLLSRLEILRSLRHELGFTPAASLTSSRQLRAIIEAHLSGDLVLLLNHWKSQRGGFLQTLSQRQQAATLLARRLKQLQGRYILVLGDFNEPVDSYFRYPDTSFLPIVASDSPSEAGKPLPSRLQISAAAAPQPVLLSPWFAYASYFRRGQMPSSGPFWDNELEAPVLLAQNWPTQLSASLLPTELGSYYFRGEWQTIDNIFLCFPASGQQSAGLSGWRFSRFAVPRFAPLLRNGRPQPWRPERISGLSDHLPLLLELERFESVEPDNKQ